MQDTMKKLEGLALAASLALGGAVPSLATDNNNWQAADGVYDGVYTNLAHWSRGHLPATQEYLTVVGSPSYTIAFPEGETATEANWNPFSDSSSIVTFDGRGATFRQKAVTDTSYEQWYSCKLNDVLSLERNGGGVQLTKAGAVFTDFVFALANRYHLVFKEGTFDYTQNGGRNTLFLNYYNGYSSLVVEKGATLMAANSFDMRCYTAHTRIDVNGGTLKGNALNHPTSEGANNYAVHQDDLYVHNGGTASFSGAVQIGNHAGKSAKRTFNMAVTDGASLSASSVQHYYGNFNLALTNATCTLGGHVYLVNGTSGSYKGTLTLGEGGVLTCGRVVVGGGAGTATFASDGGTIKPNQKMATFLDGFESAKLGAKGLTLDTAYDVAIDQSFANADGASGRFVKTGAGTLTLSGAGSAFGALEVREGGLVLTDAARVAAALTVTGGAAASLGAANGLTALTLGDAASTGGLTLTAGTTIAVDGPVSFANPDFTLAGTFASGSSYALLTAKGDVDAAKAVWAAAVFRAGTTKGLAYATRAETDETTGVTTFFIDVTTAPSETKIVSADETSDAAASVTPYGDFALTVDSGATYSLAHPLTAGFLTKDGTGTLTAFLDCLKAYQNVELKDGVLALNSFVDGATLTVNKASGTTVIDTPRDVTVSAMAVKSGGWVKHGAGTLTVLNDGTAEQTLTATNGCVTTDSTPGATVVRVGPGFDPPTMSWTGLSVAEGTVCLKGTGAGAKFNLRHSVAVGVPTPDVTVQPRLVVDNCEAYTGNNSYHFFLAPNVNASNSANYPGCSGELIVTNGAKFRVDTLCVADTVRGEVREAHPKMVVDGSTFLSGFKLQFSRTDSPNYVPRYEFVNGARVYTGHANLWERTSTSIETYGSTELLVDNSELGCATSYAPSSVGGLTVRIASKGNVSDWTFRNGAKFWCKMLCTSWDLKSATLTFDNATWRHDGGTNLCVEASDPDALKLVVAPGGLTFNATDDVRVQHPFAGAGALVKTGAGQVWFDVAARYNAGASEARANPVTVACDVTVAEGEIAVSPGAASGTNVVTLAKDAALELRGQSVDGLVLAGPGTVKNGTLVAPAFCAESEEDGKDVVTLAADATLSGAVSVWFKSPLSAPYPQDVLIARYEGEAPELSRGTVAPKPGQPRLRAILTAASGEIRATIYRSGLAIVVR